MAKTTRTGTASAAAENLPYCIELWRPDKTEVEWVLGRALNSQLARAIFTAAKSEYPERRITLRKGTRVIADSAG
jgi:hypothetical protein